MHVIRFNGAVLLLVGFVLSGCAFADALRFGPNFSRIKVGSPRAVVENELSYPRTRVISKRGLTVDIYEYRLNDNPSRIRAVGNLLKSVGTLGFWEIWATERTSPYRLRVVYDKNDRVVEIRQVDVFADQEYESSN